MKEFIQSLYPLSTTSLLEIEKILEERIIPKGEVFIKKDKPNRFEYFLCDGICKSYLVNPKGDEITLSFFESVSVLSPHTIRTSNNISLLNFKALTPLKVAVMDSEAFLELMVQNLEIRSFGNEVLRRELALKVEKEIGLVSLTARERLIAFRKKHALLENLVPHTDIATYLGITNISLSRLRRELLK